VVGCAYLLSRESGDLATAARRLTPARVALSATLAVAGSLCMGRTWLALVRGFGVRVDSRDAGAVFYTSQLGKYVPGSVWPVLAQVRLGARWGAPRRVMLGAGLLLLTMLTVTGLLVGAVLLPWSSADGLRRYWWLLLLLPPLLALLHPRVVSAVIDRVALWAGGERIGARVSARGLRQAALWSLLAWVLLGTHLLVLMTAYGRLDALDAVVAVGGIGLAWAAGLAVVPAPAGAGVREGVLVLTLGPVVGGEAAVTVALASRVLLVLADIALAGSSVGLRALRGVRSERAGTSARGRAASASGRRTPARRDQNA
jgi:hypothetical protein